MHRTQWIAAVALLLVVGGLLLGRLSGGGQAATEAAADVAAPAPTEEAAPAPTSTAPPVPEPERLGQAQQFVRLDGWLQTDADNLDDFDGQVRIVQFWTFGCYNCTATIPHLQEIYAQYEPQGLEILGVHAAEFDYEKDPVAIEEAAARLGVTWP
ncbi:MAG: redoxin domain-containing protein, partial [Actinomycetota bacterium]